jgi:hypothetical protein
MEGIPFVKSFGIVSLSAVHLVGILTWICWLHHLSFMLLKCVRLNVQPHSFVSYKKFEVSEINILNFVKVLTLLVKAIFAQVYKLTNSNEIVCSQLMILELGDLSINYDISCQKS